MGRHKGPITKKASRSLGWPLHVVGVTRFELVTSSVSGKRSPPELNARLFAALERRRGNERGQIPLAPDMSWSGLRGSNPRPPPWQGGALPTAPSPRRKEIQYRTDPTRASPNFNFFLCREERAGSCGKKVEICARRSLVQTPRVPTRGCDANRVPTPMPFSAGSSIDITRSGPRRLPRPADCSGGGTPIRTGGKGFAVPCLTTWPCRRYEKSRTGIRLQEHMERATGFEPATSTLARWRATNCAKPAMRGLLYGKNHECASINFQIVETDSKHDPNERQTPCST